MPLAYGTLFTERKQHKKQSIDQWRLLKKWQKNKCDNKINQVFFIFNTRYISVKSKDFHASTLVGPTRENLVLESLSVQHLDNLLYINCSDDVFCICHSKKYLFHIYLNFPSLFGKKIIQTIWQHVSLFCLQNQNKPCQNENMFFLVLFLLIESFKALQNLFSFIFKCLLKLCHNTDEDIIEEESV